MITADYCRHMARYNQWQNNGLRAALLAMDEDDLTRDHGSFFGSIMATANHLLWGDMLWMSRFDGGEAPTGGISESVSLFEDAGTWDVARFRTDGRIIKWAKSLKSIDLTGQMTWFSGAQNRHVSQPIQACAIHMFNHQTHHRGQLHAMLTASGVTMPDTDLVFMPEDS
ncbi:DinB family protein [Nereida sp. MMG025]|uniref:DinB family protein n=1 Tax=Nereida sp. MMG025 TaxID=2909981 RepID=UPI001F3DAA92|nr:DinB family protein [Nereida sp. MMG025]MCF6443428.1 damage-inducible protein DinB [Nereida sp. MMG025]